ncbi:hypothetical protein RI367_001133 [Sorochytrium milnesiophthora]
MLRGYEGPMDVDAPSDAGSSFRGHKMSKSSAPAAIGRVYAFGSDASDHNDTYVHKRKRITPFTFQSNDAAQESAQDTPVPAAVSRSSGRPTPASMYSDPPSPSLPKSPETSILSDDTPKQAQTHYAVSSSHARPHSYTPQTLRAAGAAPSDFASYTPDTSSAAAQAATSPNIFAPAVRVGDSPMRATLPRAAVRSESSRKRKMAAHVSKKIVRMWEATQVDGSDSEDNALTDDDDDDDGGGGMNGFSSPRHRFQQRLLPLQHTAQPSWQATDIPGMILNYLQVLVGTGLVFGMFYIAYLLYRSIQLDLSIKAEEFSTGILNEINECRKLYKENKCHPSTRVPGMHEACTRWEQCMDRDPARVGTMQVSAEAFADIIERFVARLSYKTMGFFAMMLGTFFVLNMSLNCLRRRPSQPARQQQQSAQPQPPYYEAQPVPVTPYYTPVPTPQPFFQAYSPYSPTPQYRRRNGSKRRHKKHEYDGQDLMLH